MPLNTQAPPSRCMADSRISDGAPIMARTGAGS